MYGDSLPMQVLVADDEPSIRFVLREALEAEGHEVFDVEDGQSAADALAEGDYDLAILDVRMPGMSGLELQRRLVDQEIRIPTLILTAHAEVSMAVEALKAGAFDFIEKPYSPQALLDSVQQALARDAQDRQARAERNDLRERFGSLSGRELEVLQRLVAGDHFKKIAAELGISATTVGFHRRNLLEKMKVDNFIELGRLFEAHQRADAPPE